LVGHGAVGAGGCLRRLKVHSVKLGACVRAAHWWWWGG